MPAPRPDRQSFDNAVEQETAAYQGAVANAPRSDADATLLAQGLPAEPQSTSWTGRPPQRQEDLNFRFFDDRTGQTVTVIQPLWKDDNWNLGGYFTMDSQGQRHNISAWSPAAAHGVNARDVVLDLLNQGLIDPGNVTITQTHAQMLGGDGAPHWIPTARQTYQDGVALFHAQRAAQIPTDSSVTIQPSDNAAFASGYRDAELGDRVLAGYALFQTSLAIAGTVVAPINMARIQGRGNFDIVNPNTGQRLRVSSNPRTGGINGTLYDRNGVPIASQTTLGRDFNRTVTVTPNNGTGTAPVDAGALVRTTPQTTVNPGAVASERSLTVSGTPITIRSETVGGTPSFTANYGGRQVPLPGARSFDEASQQVTNLANQGVLPGIAAGPVVTDSPLTLSSAGRSYQFTIRNTQETGQSAYTVHYRIGGRDRAFRLDGARTLSEASQQVVTAFNNGALPGIPSGGPVVTDSPLTLTRGGQTFNVTIRNTQDRGQSLYTVRYTAGGEDREYSLPGARNLSDASQQVTNALNSGSLPGISTYNESPLTLTLSGKSYRVTIGNLQIGSQPNYTVSYRIGGQDHTYRLDGARTLSQASQQVNDAFNSGNLPGLTRPQPQPASVGAMSANDPGVPSLSAQERASATDLTPRFPTLSEARSYAETRPETEIFSYTDHPNSPEGDDTVYFRGGQPAAQSTPPDENAPVEFIAESSMFHPDKDAFNQAINQWTDIVASGLASPNPQDRGLRQILSRIEPLANSLAREQFPNRPNIRADYGRDRTEGRRNTILNYEIFRENIPPTLEMIQRDWNNVFVSGGGRPSFPPEELMSRLQAGDPEATNLVYPWTIDTASGQLPTAFITITPPDPSLIGNPYPFTITTFYPSNAQSITAIKDALSNRWRDIQSIPAGDPAAISAIADFMYDYNKVYWHWHGDGEIGSALMAGYLRSKGFEIERMTPGLDINGQSFQTTRQEYIDNFVNGRYFELRNPPDNGSNVTNPINPGGGPITNAQSYLSALESASTGDDVIALIDRTDPQLLSSPQIIQQTLFKMNETGDFIFRADTRSAEQIQADGGFRLRDASSFVYGAVDLFAGGGHQHPGGGFYVIKRRQRIKGLDPTSSISGRKATAGTRRAKGETLSI
ncbi:MAG: hypothetical protein HC850_01605 [Rhodomicrobium sp.]|nr:hypothetical protein [Rhodomicrobium sp.]